MNLKKQIIDQVAHVAVGAALVAPALLLSPMVAGAVYSLAFALYRELVKQRPVNSWADTVADLIFWAFGVGLVVCLA
jgi:formate/nitrite transporter FocA (FNT family)